jgi:probable sporulation protein (polysaccharide deacetylase family)
VSKRKRISLLMLTLCVGCITPNEMYASDNSKDLYGEINRKAMEEYIAPIEAKEDRIWKAMPGYNGLEVDIENTYHLNKASGNTELIQLLYKEVPPKTRISDLLPNPIYRGNPEKPIVSIMINVAWGNEYIPSILETLRENNIRTTFFFDGSWLNKNTEMARNIAKDGHELSNHAYSHKNMSQLRREQVINEISKTEKLLQTQLNVKNTLFAPPSGDFNMDTVRIAYELNLKTILWTLDTLDWKNPSPSSIVKKIDKNVEPGFLILMHPTKSSSQALDGMIRVIKRKGLSVGTVSEVISESRILNHARKL